MEDSSPFSGTNNTPFLNFWWRLPSVLRPRWIPLLPRFVACAQIYPALLNCSCQQTGFRHKQHSFLQFWKCCSLVLRWVLRLGRGAHTVWSVPSLQHIQLNLTEMKCKLQGMNLFGFQTNLCAVVYKDIVLQFQIKVVSLFVNCEVAIDRKISSLVVTPRKLVMIMSL